jgi:hypothetical protein
MEKPASTRFEIIVILLRKAGMKHQRKEQNPPPPRLAKTTLVGDDIAAEKYQVTLCMIMRPPCMSFCSLLMYTQTMNHEIAVEKLLSKLFRMFLQKLCSVTRRAWHFLKRRGALDPATSSSHGRKGNLNILIEVFLIDDKTFTL